MKDVTLREALEAEAEGIAPGDPTRLVVRLDYGYGNGVGITFSDVAIALWLTWKVVEGLDTAQGAVEGIRRVRDFLVQRLRSGADVYAKHGERWATRGGAPIKVRQMLWRRNWEATDLAQLLGCSVDEAAAMLWSHGYECGEDGMWRPGDREGDHGLLVALHRLAEATEAETEYGRLALAEEVQEHIRQYLEDKGVEHPPWDPL